MLAIRKEEALEVLVSSKVDENVKITTTTQTTVNEQTSTSIQTDYYHDNKYYHTSDAEGVSTKTWYGYIEDVLYAFYYTKNADNNEVKSSSRIEASQLEAVQKQPNSIIDSLLTQNNTLAEGYDLVASKIGDKYTIEINKNGDDQSDIYTITIASNRIITIVKNSSIEDDSIKITYTYDYNIEDFELPSLDDYPLSINN